jgi:predicted porin
VPPISGIFVTVDYRLEVEPTGANSARLDQFDDDNADDSVGPLFVRHSYMYLSSKKYGEVRLGLTATPIYNITKDTNVSELEDTEHGDNRMMQSFFLRPKGFDNAEGLSTLRWQSISRCYSSSNAFVCSTRRNGAAYWSPTVAGFSASVGWYKDDDWSAAIRYKDEWGENWEVGAGFGYEDFRDERLQNGGGGVASGANPPFPPPNNINFFKRDIQEYGGSASIKHKPTGLFGLTSFMWSDQNDSNTVNAGFYTETSAPLMNSWEVELGIQRKMGFLSSFGDTSFWGGYEKILTGLGAAATAMAEIWARSRPTGRSFFCAALACENTPEGCCHGATDSCRALEFFQSQQPLNRLCDRLEIETARAHLVCGE